VLHVTVDTDLTNVTLVCLCQQVVADRIGLQTSLASGDYSRAWNEVILSSADVSEASDC